MKEYIVSLDILTRSASLEELTGIIGLEPAQGSGSIGDKGRRGPIPRTVWRFESMADPQSPLEEHFQNILSSVPLKELMSSRRLPADAEFLMDVGVFFDGPMCSVDISAESIRLLSQYSLQIEVSCYPGPMDNGSET